MSGRAEHDQTPGLIVFGELCLVFAVAMLVRLVDFQIVPPDPDDLLHLYAARSYLIDGSLSIFSGIYLRAADYTRLVAASIYLFGDSLSSARLPALLSGAALVAAVYGWMRAEVGRAAAILSGGILALLAPAIEVSVLVRFYALQSLLFWLGAAMIYSAIARPKSWQTVALYVVIGLAAWGEAARLQVTTAIGVMCFLLWAFLFVMWRLRLVYPRRTLLFIWVAVVLVGIVVLSAMTFLGITGRLYELYRATAFWATPDRDYFQYYYHEMTKTYGLFLDLFPLAALLAVLWYPRPAIYCCAVFVLGLVLHSFAGMKGARYIFYLVPFFACVWAMAGCVVIALVRDRLVVLLPRAMTRASRLVTVAIGCFLGLIVVKAVPVFEVSARSVFQPGYHRQFDSRDQAWVTSQGVLRPLMEKVDVFVVDDDLLADFHLGRADLVLNKSRLLENNPADEFQRDFRTGTPTISDEASIRTVLSCFGSGLIVTYEPFLKWLSPASQSLLADHTRRLDLARDFVGFVWSEAAGSDVPDCEAVRRLTLETTARRREG